MVSGGGPALIGEFAEPRVGYPLETAYAVMCSTAEIPSRNSVASTECQKCAASAGVGGVPSDEPGFGCSGGSFLTERQCDRFVQCQLTPGLPLRTEGVAEPLAGRLCSPVHKRKRVARVEPLAALFGNRLGCREQSHSRAGIGLSAKARERGERFDRQRRT